MIIAELIFGGGLIFYRPQYVTTWLNARCWKCFWQRLMTLIAMKAIKKGEVCCP